jgi:D-alanine transaminase
LIEALERQGLALEERAFTVVEAYEAREAFITGASQIVMPVVRIDGRLVDNGRPGQLATALRRDFHKFSEWE